MKDSKHEDPEIQAAKMQGCGKPLEVVYEMNTGHATRKLLDLTNRPKRSYYELF